MLGRVRVRAGKWEDVILSGILSFLLLSAIYYGWVRMASGAPEADSWFGWTSVVVIGQAGIGYWIGQRNQRKLDQLELAMKQAAAGNWESRLPVQQGDAFSGANREFNELLCRLEARMKLLQELGEREITEDATLQESAVLEERKRLARDLHDTVSQQLFALHMSASSLPMLVERDMDHARQVMDQLIGMSSTAQKQMRGLIAQLRPLELQGRTLEEAVDRWFPDYCRQNGLQGTLELQLTVRLSEAKEHQLFLIIQEAMANVVKHAEAKRVRLLLGIAGKQATLSIEDDGAGFRSEQVRSGAYGLSTMRERAQRLGGEAEIVTKPGSGTRVRVSLPIFDRA
ncbi:sensor histidine kinase [Cohnella suwonensis]|uniref:Oxygen sensor histidine kinase NreB n=1 Tax=Cohnella suwonensis TaxID=696072 RepID=A0ABW0LUI2_9BACL